MFTVLTIFNVFIYLTYTIAFFHTGLAKLLEQSNFNTKN
jgi:hypothetical protein